MNDRTTGRCLCGDISFEYDPDAVRWTGHCTCESCRRSTSSPVTTFVGVSASGFRWTGAAPAPYESSPGVTRSFCPRCGSQMAFESQRWPGEVHIYAASLRDPTGVEPQAIFHYHERLPWLEIAGDLPHR